mgnify:CR=1 FL=1
MNNEDDNCSPHGKEVGYHYIHTGFTGSISPQLSGHEEFPFLCSDMGTASTLKERESAE